MKIKEVVARKKGEYILDDIKKIYILYIPPFDFPECLLFTEYM